MECINFDEQFERYATEWMRENAAKYKDNYDRMEAKMPEVYLQFLNTPAKWLGGTAPGTYFSQFSDAAMLGGWMLDYHKRGIPVPDQLLERLTSLGSDAESVLLAYLEDCDVPEEVRLTSISMLSEMESRAPLALYVAWIAARERRDERADLAAEALSAMGRAVVAPVLNAVRGATQSGRETFLDVLCNFPGDPAIYDLAITMFRTETNRRALFASLLGKLGDERAIPALLSAIGDPELSYLDFIELRNAIEALGGDAPAEREFSGDPYYESLRRME